MHAYNKTFYKCWQAIKWLRDFRLFVYSMLQFIFRSGIDMVGLMAELTDAASILNGLNTLTYSSDISHPSSLSSDISNIKI
jgi:hypothetical protein